MENKTTTTELLGYEVSYPTNAPVNGDMQNFDKESCVKHIKFLIKGCKNNKLTEKFRARLKKLSTSEANEFYYIQQLVKALREYVKVTESNINYVNYLTLAVDKILVTNENNIS